MGGRRGRLIRVEERKTAVELLNEATDAGARQWVACDALGISNRTFQRWRAGAVDRRKGASKQVRNKLSETERKELIDTACSQEYQSLTPWQIVPMLAEKGIYVASERTFYRVLKEESLLHHRTNTRPASHHSRPPELVASGPNQVFSWDITYLRTFVAGIYLYAYLVIDVFSRKIVGWTVSEVESENIAVDMFERLRLQQDLTDVFLHSDNGNPMKGATMIATLYKLGLIPSFSRPRVSDDNPFSESLFKTVKYHRTYPGKFCTKGEALKWFAGFINWYNTEHLHSGIGYVTPEARHTGAAQAIYDARNATYARACRKHPERWSRGRRKWGGPELVFLNPSEETMARNRKKSAA